MRRPEDIGMSGYLRKEDMPAATDEAAGWIEHDGSGRPIEDGTTIELIMRGTPHEIDTTGAPETLRWNHIRSATADGYGDIIAYRVVQA